MNNVVIDIDRVSFNYTDVPVLRDISLQIRAAEFIGIIGPNASGKSTLLKLILGLLAPDTGTISRFNRAGKKDRAGRIGYVPQHVGFARDFPITVREAVLLGHVSAQAMPFGYSRRQLAAAEQAMAALEIEALGRRQIGRLSGGQLQRVLIARALVSGPEVLILDEPTSSVDVRAEEDIYALLKQYSERMTIIIVSHDIAFISGYVDRVACLNQTLVCHDTQAINGDIIKQLYAAPVKLIDHRH